LAPCPGRPRVGRQGGDAMIDADQSTLYVLVLFFVIAVALLDR
jgi:hypothetical protein